MILAHAQLIIAAIINIFLGAVVWSKNKKIPANIWYALVVFSGAAWTIGLFAFLVITDLEPAVEWARFYYMSAAFIAYSFLHFSLNFPFRNKKYGVKLYLFTFIPLLIIFYFLYFTDLLISVIYYENWGKDVVLGEAYIFYTFYFTLYILASFIIWFRKYKISDRTNKLRLKYVLIGTGIALSFGAFFDLYLPIINYKYIWVGPPFQILMAIFMFYAIIKYRLMNIRLAITRSILYTTLIGLITGFFAFSITITTNFLGIQSDYGRAVVYVIDSFLIVIFLDPLRNFLARITDNLFYKDKIDYQKLLQEAGTIIAKEIDLKLLSEKLSSLLSHRLKIKTVHVYDNDYKTLASFGQKPIALNDDLSGFLSVQTDTIIIEELIRDINNDKYNYNSKELNKIVDSLQGLGVEMIVPILDADKHIAYLLLSEKQSGDLYNEEDIEFFKVLIPQIASAFEKSQLYNEVQKFNIKLQKKVDEKTSSLKEANEALEARNKFLTTMQVVANMLSRTLDLKQVTQMIADSISTELGYVGGIVSFVDDKRENLQVKAITNTEETKMILNTLPEDLKNYKAEMKIGYNLAVDTVLSGEMKYSQNLADFVCPPADEEIIGVAQEALQIKTIVGVPIYSEDRVIGLINFLLPFPEEDISFLDREIMTAMTNQVGILYRNLELYDNLQGTNKELQEANVHLRALDKAKSEFVSIASHQLRTPISAIKGYLSMLMEGDFGELSSSVKNVIEGLFESSSRLARLVNTFLNVSRIESGRLKLDIKPVDIDTLVTSVVDELSNEAAQKGLKLTYEKEKDLPNAMADSDKIREVILNLIDNSIKYTPKGSVKVSLFADDEKLTFQVKDTGIGIDPIEAKGLFRKFVRGSGVAQIHTGGSGLGLFIAQRIINEHQGKIWAESKGREKGSTFKFEIPIEKN